LEQFKSTREKENAAADLVKSISQQSTLVPLGELPDRRAVVWLRSDPYALYISDRVEISESDEKMFHACLRRENQRRTEKLRSNGWHCCLWGCSFVKNGYLVEYPCKLLADEHIRSFHSYFGSCSHLYSFGEKKSFGRVVDSGSVKRLVRGLTQAACARSAALMGRAKRTPAEAAGGLQTDHIGERIAMSPCADILSLDPRDIDEALLHVPCETAVNEPLYSILDLLKKILQLFALDEGRKSLRLTKGASMGLKLSASCWESNVGREESIAKRGLFWAPCRDLESSIADVAKTGCSLCSFSSEEAIQWATKENVTKENEDFTDISPSIRRGGIGCSIPGNILFNFGKGGTKTISGDLGMAKMVLLRMAQTIPEYLRFSCDLQGGSNAKGEGAVSFLKQRMWQPEGNRAFCEFVMASCSVDMASQAFVALLASVKRDKFPAWWQGESGGAQRLLLSPTKSSLLLQLLLFDVALSEHIEAGIQDPPLKALIATKGVNRFPKKFQDLNRDDLASELIATARRNSICTAGTYGDSDDDGHEYFCCICNEGGELICCSVCEHVAHGSCIGMDPATAKEWVCYCCTVDLVQMQDR